MANAKKCDRCGNFYDLYSGIRVKRRGAFFKVTCARLASASNDVCFDLCPTCAKAIAIFFGLETEEEDKHE